MHEHTSSNATPSASEEQASNAALRRQHLRFAADISVQVHGVHAAAEPRRGNVSISGMYLPTQQEMGPPGSLHMLTLASPNDTHQVTVLARVVRVVRVQDFFTGGALTGIAFHFLPREQDELAQLQIVVRAIIENSWQESTEIGADTGFLVDVRHTGSPEPMRGWVRRLGASRLTLDLSCALQEGEDLECHLSSSGTSPKGGHVLAGKIVSCTPITLPAAQTKQAGANLSSDLISDDAQRSKAAQAALIARTEPHLQSSKLDLDASFRIELDLSGKSQSHTRPPPHTQGAALHALHATLGEARLPDAQHPHEVPGQVYTGQLNAVPLNCVLRYIFERRLSGYLRVESEGRQRVLAIAHGEILDVAPAGRNAALDHHPPDARLEDILVWDTGAFRFQIEETIREADAQI